MGVEQKIYTIADAHLDTSWVWKFETTVGEYIPRTFNENFDLFEKYPEYKFNFEGSYRYELMKEYYPKSFEKVKEYIEKGRWYPVGSCYENGDVNIPSPEALIRNVIYGNGFFRDHFGKESNDIFLPDCFGFGKALPSVAAHCGITGFSTQKLTWGCAVPIPFDIGRWRGLDGNGLWCALKTGNYTAVLDKVRTDKDLLKKLKENSEKYGFNFTSTYHGVGDRGGAPKEKSVKTVVTELRQNAENAIKVLSATTRELFDDIEALPEEQKKKMPVFDGEFLMTEHGAGSYTTRTVSKRWNRRSELLADAAERTAVSAFILGLADYPLNVLDTAWKRTIAHQFHDDITGTSWMVDYKRNWNDYVQSMFSFSTEYTVAVKAVTGAMNTSFAKGIPVAVSNPVQSTGSVSQAVSAEICADMIPESARVFDCRGNEVPSQVSSLSGGKKKVTFIAAVPSNGIAVYDVRPSADSFSGETGLTVTGNTLENKRYKVTIDGNGDIVSVFDKKLGKELLSAPVQFQLINDIQIYHYAAWEVKYKDIMSKPYACAANPEFEIAESGPALVALKTKRTAGGSFFTQVISLDAESDFIRVYNEVDWRSESSDLKVSFPFKCADINASYDIGLGYYARGNNTKEQFEVPAQRWADISGRDSGFGVSVLSDSRTGWDKPKSNVIRLTAMHTATNNHSPMTGQHVADFGLNRFSFGIFGHEGKPDFTAGAADRFCQPMHTFICDSHKGKLDPEFSLCSVSSDTVRILGIKKAQKTDEIVIRLCEYTGKAQKGVKIQFALPVKSAKEIRGDEIEIGDIPVADGVLDVDFTQNQVRSFALTLDGTSKYRKKYGAIDLPYDKEAASSNESDSKCLLGNGFSVPSELVPETLLEGGVEYTFVSGGKNAVECKGQTIAVPKDAKTVHFILTSVSGDRKAEFSVDGKAVQVIVQDCFEAVGAWDLIGLGETGYIKKNPQYFTFTHTHSSAGDELAKQFYLFHAAIPCAKASEIKLPDDRNILVFAASYSKDANCALPGDEHFDTLEKRSFDYVLSKYAQSQLRDSKFQEFMGKMIEKIEHTEPNQYFTAKRKEKARDLLRIVKDSGVDGRKSIRIARVAIARRIQNRK